MHKKIQGMVTEWDTAFLFTQPIAEHALWMDATNAPFRVYTNNSHRTIFLQGLHIICANANVNFRQQQPETQFYCPTNHAKA